MIGILVGIIFYVCIGIGVEAWITHKKRRSDEYIDREDEQFGVLLCAILWPIDLCDYILEKLEESDGKDNNDDL